MNLFRRGHRRRGTRRRGPQHTRVPTRPPPPDDTVPFGRPTVTLLPDPTTLTFPRLLPPIAIPAPDPPGPPMPPGWVPAGWKPPPARDTLPAPVTPSSLPALKPPRPRQAWKPPAPPPAEPTPAVAAEPRITQPAKLAYPGGRVPPELTLPCASCHRVHTRGATTSFRALYTAAGQDGWRRDRFGTWACPPCQQRPGWWAPNIPALCGEYPELALVLDVAAAAASRWQVRRALRNPRVLLDATALGALRP